MAERNGASANRTSEIPVAQVLVFNHDLRTGEVTSDPDKIYTFSPGEGVVIKSLSHPQRITGSMDSAKIVAEAAKRRGEFLTLAFHDSEKKALSLVLPNGTQVNITLANPNYPVQMNHVEENLNPEKTVITLGVIGTTQEAIDNRLKQWRQLLPRIKTL